MKNTVLVLLVFCISTCFSKTPNYICNVKFFVYKHTRLDNLEPFYIGIGRYNEAEASHKVKYKRAYSCQKRNIIWRNISAKVGFSVEIVFESESELDVKQEEIRLISVLGRRDKKLGPLVNNTDGGDGRLNPNDESMKNVGKNLDAYREARRKKVYQYDLTGKYIRMWDTLTDAFKSLNVQSSKGIVMCCKKKIYFYKGFQWSYNFLGDEIGPPQKQKTNAKKIKKICLKTGEILNIFMSSKEAESETGISRKGINNCLKENAKSAGRFNWEYLTIEIKNGNNTN